MNEQLFFSVFRNKYLRFIISKFILIVNNRLVVDSNQFLKNHSFRDFIKVLVYRCNDPLVPYESIPSNVKQLWLMTEFEQEIKVGDIGQSIEHLIILDLKKRIIKGALHSTSVKRLEINQYQYQLEQGDLPESLSSLYLGDYNQPLDIVGSLPSKLQKLTLIEFKLNIVVNVLPSSLRAFKDISNNSIGYSINILPRSLCKLVLYNGFNEPLEPNLLPPTLTYLEMRFFNHQLSKNVLPNSLQTLLLISYNHPLNQCIPPNVKILQLDEFDQDIGISDLPDSIQELYMYSFNQPLDSSGVIPNNLRVLEIGAYDRLVLNQNVLPNSLEQLVIGELYQSFQLPSSITNLNILKFNGPLSTISLPPIKTLGFNEFNQPLFDLPSSTTELNLGLIFNQKIISFGSLYSTCIKRITFSFYFNSEIQVNSLPVSLTYVNFNSHFNQTISEGILSSLVHLKFIKFGYYFQSQILPNSIPSSVEKIIFSRSSEDYKELILPNSIPKLTQLIFNDD